MIHTRNRRPDILPPIYNTRIGHRPLANRNPFPAIPRALCLLVVWLLVAACQARMPTMLRVVDLRGTHGQPELLTWLGSLQGTLNREDGDAAIFLVRNQDDADWADTLTRMYSLRREVLSPPALLTTTKATLTGQVRYDPAQPWTRDIALTAAANATGQVIATADDLGLPTVLDLRNRWADAAHAYTWALEEYAPHSEAGTGLVALTPSEAHPLADLIAARKLQAMELSPLAAEDSPLLRMLLKTLRTGGQVLGGPAGDAPVADISRALVSLHDDRPLTYIPVNQTANLSCFARFPITRPLWQGHDELPTLETLHTLVLVYDSGVSVGENSQSLDYATIALKRLLDDEAMTDLPVAVEVPTALLDYAPAVYQSLLARQRLRHVEFIAAPASDPQHARAMDLEAGALQGDNGQWPTVDAVKEVAQQGWKGAVNRPLSRADVPGWMLYPNLVSPNVPFPVLPSAHVRTLDELRRALPQLEKLEIMRGLTGQLFVIYLDPAGIPPALLSLALPEIERSFSLLTPSQAFRGKIEYDAVGAYLREKQALRPNATPQRAKPTVRIAMPTTTLAAPTAADAIPITVHIDGEIGVLAARIIYATPNGRLLTADMADAGNGLWTTTLPPTLTGGALTLTARVVENGGFGISYSPPLTLNIPMVDADADGADDTLESYQGTDPHNPDTDGNGLPDGIGVHPTHPDRDVAALALPIRPPADAPALLEVGKSTVTASGRVIPAGGAISYRLDLRDLPAAPAFVHLVTTGPGTVAINGGTAIPLTGAVGGDPAETDVLLPTEITADSARITLTAGKQPLQVISLSLTGDPDGPYIRAVQLTPEFPPAKLPIAVRVLAYDRAGITTVRLRYGPDPRHLATLTLTPQPGVRKVIFTGELPPQQDGSVLVYGAEVEDAAGHRAASPYRMTTVGFTARHSVALRGSYDLRGDWKPGAPRGSYELGAGWQPAAIWGRLGRRLTQGDGIDKHLFLARPGTYQVWILAQPWERGIAVTIERLEPYETDKNVVKLARALPAGTPDGWYRLGAFTVPESIRLTITVRPIGEQGTCGYGEMVLTQDEHFTPPLHRAGIDWYNSMTVFGIESGQQVSGKLPLTVLATGNIDAVDVQVTTLYDEADSRDAMHLPRQHEGVYLLDTAGWPAGRYILRAIGKRIILGDKSESGTLVETDVPFTVAGQ